MDIMGSSSLNRQEIFDPIRGSFVKATPEEIVRQHWLRKMVGDLLFPKGLLAVEKGLKELPHLSQAHLPDRRIDIFCYGMDASNSLFPLLLIECKREKLTGDALNQLIGYNHFVKAPFLAAVTLNEVQFGVVDASQNKIEYCSFIPSFKELMQWACR
jgi:hypothetical protein